MSKTLNVEASIAPELDSAVAAVAAAAAAADRHNSEEVENNLLAMDTSMEGTTTLDEDIIIKNAIESIRATYDEQKVAFCPIENCKPAKRFKSIKGLLYHLTMRHQEPYINVMKSRIHVAFFGENPRQLINKRFREKNLASGDESAYKVHQRRCESSGCKALDDAEAQVPNPMKAKATKEWQRLRQEGNIFIEAFESGFDIPDVSLPFDSKLYSAWMSRYSSAASYPPSIQMNKQAVDEWDRKLSSPELASIDQFLAVKPALDAQLPVGIPQKATPEAIREYEEQVERLHKQKWLESRNERKIVRRKKRESRQGLTRSAAQAMVNSMDLPEPMMVASETLSSSGGLHDASDLVSHTDSLVGHDIENHIHQLNAADAIADEVVDDALKNASAVGADGKKKRAGTGLFQLAEAVEEQAKKDAADKTDDNIDIELKEKSEGNGVKVGLDVPDLTGDKRFADALAEQSEPKRVRI